MLKFETVKSTNIPQLAQLADTIWHEYWTEILSPQQIDYMIEKFQSETAILKQYRKDHYTYYFIKLNNNNAGYFGISAQKDYLFLSKLYISKHYRHQGIGSKAFEEIIKIAKTKNYNKIQLTVNKYNENTIKAYQKWGFVTIDSVVTDIGNGFVMDDYIMEYKI